MIVDAYRNYLGYFDADHYFSREFTIIFALLSVFTLTVPFITYFQDLVCHGKRNSVQEVSCDGGTKWIKQAPEERWFYFYYIPKSCFIHMYVVGSLLGGCCYYYTIRNIFDSGNGLWFKQKVAVQGVIMFELHCLRRLWECLNMTEYGSSSMNILAYFVGIGHYLLTPTCIMCALLQNDSRAFPRREESVQIYLRTISISLFIVGNLCQFKCHRILYFLKLNKSIVRLSEEKSDRRSSNRITQNKSCQNDDPDDMNGHDSSFNTNSYIRSCDSSISSKSHGYSFPRGFGFDYVACPHYSSEILIYISFWLLAPSSSSLICLTIWVACNLSVVADSQYMWYKKVFPEETRKKRYWKRIFPGLW